MGTCGTVSISIGDRMAARPYPCPHRHAQLSAGPVIENLRVPLTGTVQVSKSWSMKACSAAPLSWPWIWRATVPSEAIR